ncbi:MAG: trimeric intracellular cation channel family protein [Desulfobulbaceae bacterium]|nr:trimeric intracellular cation channel family protein [Desulfobulbaceae bacterium]
MNSVQIIHLLDLFGVAVFAVSGALAAGRKRMDIFGVVVLGLVTALGGGTLRDTLLDSGPVFWINHPVYLLVAVVFSLLTFFAVWIFTSHKLGLLISDAFGLAIFTAIGTATALITTDSKSVAIIMGVMTGTAGGMMRDVLSAEVPLILQREIYATAALCGSFVYVTIKSLGFQDTACIIISVSVTLLIRLAAIHWGLSLPVLQSEEAVGKN